MDTGKILFAQLMEFIRSPNRWPLSLRHQLAS
jgi:hypothetical protein